MTTAEHRRFLRHLETCRVCKVGGQCRTGRWLLQDADAADWRRPSETGLPRRALVAAR